MTVRPFHLIPARGRLDIGRAAAAFFFAVSVLSLPAAILFLVIFSVLGLIALASLEFGPGAVMMGIAAYIVWGFAQMLFYLRRLVGSDDHDHIWWVSTFVYNLPVLWVAYELAKDGSGVLASGVGFAALGLFLSAAAAADALLARR